MTEDLDAPARNAALALAEAMAAFLARALGARLLGVYVMGSLAHGGFSRRYSDIDMAVLAEDGLGADEMAAVREHAAAHSPDLASKLSLFWADRGFSVGRFPPLDRVDLIDHAVALRERERVRPARPPREDVRAYLRGTPFSSWREGAARFAELQTLTPKDHKPFIRAHLYAARFVYSWMTGGMNSNDEAVAFTVAAAPVGLDLGLLEAALACRGAARDPDALFPARHKLPAQVAACARFLDQ
ncbi:MAG TPA: hypothetical protein VL993_17360 [Stellaceae bacterium]|nr:hypothetical protein [Stellaceae bacterium]